MREIKFRAWNEARRNMFYLEDGQSLSDFFNRNTQSISKLMQFTGLKDNNGREIYEGDILVDLEVSPSYKNKRVIRNFVEDTFFILDDMKYNINEKSVFEVIGNIYENPELLEEKSVVE